MSDTYGVCEFSPSEKKINMHSIKSPVFSKHANYVCEGKLIGCVYIILFCIFIIQYFLRLHKL